MSTKDTAITVYVQTDKGTRSYLMHDMTEYEAIGRAVHRCQTIGDYNHIVSVNTAPHY